MLTAPALSTLSTGSAATSRTSPGSAAKASASSPATVFSPAEIACAAVHRGPSFDLREHRRIGGAFEGRIFRLRSVWSSRGYSERRGSFAPRPAFCRRDTVSHCRRPPTWLRTRACYIESQGINRKFGTASLRPGWTNDERVDDRSPLCLASICPLPAFLLLRSPWSRRLTGLRAGARRLALGYGMGIVYVGLEFILTRQVDLTPVGIGISSRFPARAQLRPDRRRLSLSRTAAVGRDGRDLGRHDPCRAGDFQHDLWVDPAADALSAPLFRDADPARSYDLGARAAARRSTCC